MRSSSFVLVLVFALSATLATPPYVVPHLNDGLTPRSNKGSTEFKKRSGRHRQSLLSPRRRMSSEIGPTSTASLTSGIYEFHYPKCSRGVANHHEITIDVVTDSGVLYVSADRAAPGDKDYRWKIDTKGRFVFVTSGAGAEKGATCTAGDGGLCNNHVCSSCDNPQQEYKSGVGCHYFKGRQGCGWFCWRTGHLVDMGSASCYCLPAALSNQNNPNPTVFARLSGGSMTWSFKCLYDSCNDQYVHEPNSKTCVPKCPAGEFMRSSGDACVQCSPGQYMDQKEHSFDSCKDCGAGSYGDVSGLNECKNCDSGMFTSATGASSCKDCPIGKSSSTMGMTECSECLIGQFQDQTKKSSCKNCPDGWEQSQTGPSACTECSTGRYWKLKSGCNDCPSGWYVEVTKSKNCKECGLGEMGPNAKLAACVDCQAGTYQSEKGQTICDECDAGKYTELERQKECVECPINTIIQGGKNDGLPGESNGCQNCPEGYDTSGNDGSSTCYEACPESAGCCQVGTHCTDDSCTNCESCPVGYFTLEKNKPSCTKCATGTFKVSNTTVECAHCPRGYYQEEEGQTKCFPCGSGKYGDVLGSGSKDDCSPCQKGSYSKEQGRSSTNFCQECAAGTYSSTSGATTIATCKNCDSGLYSKEPGRVRTEDCYKCPAGYSGSEAGATFCLRCPAGWTNAVAKQTVCIVCTPGLFMNVTGSTTTECTACPRGYHQGSSEYQRSECDECNSGLYQDEIGASACNSGGGCPQGKYTDVTGAWYECKNCPVGFTTQRENSNFECASCGPGKYGMISTATSSSSGGLVNSSSPPTCQSCPIGWVSSSSSSSPSTGRTACTPCAEDYYQDVEESVLCQECIGGSYASGLGNSKCHQCPAGYYRKQSTKYFVGCSRCENGTISVSGQEDCTSCKAGLYSNSGENGGKSIQCVSCMSGKYQNQEKQSTCLVCPIGWAQSLEQSIVCGKCDAGFYNSDGNRACVQCPSGYFSNDEESNCTACAIGRFSKIRSSSCDDCPVGQVSSSLNSTSCVLCQTLSVVSDDIRKTQYSLFYQDEIGQTKCKTCDIGLFSAGTFCAQLSQSVASPQTPEIDYSRAVQSLRPDGQVLRFQFQWAEPLAGSAKLKPYRFVLKYTFDFRGCVEATDDANDVVKTERDNEEDSNEDSNEEEKKRSSGVLAADIATDGSSSRTTQRTTEVFTSCGDGRGIGRMTRSSCKNEMELDWESISSNHMFQIDIELSVPSWCGLHFSKDDSAFVFAEYGEPNTAMDVGPIVAFPTWRNAHQCGDASFFDVTQTNPTLWQCLPCPAGTHCAGPVVFDDVRALFGWHRLVEDGTIGIVSHTNTSFVPCKHPPACLGAPNTKYRGKYVQTYAGELERDPSNVPNSTESCNWEDGYELYCDGLDLPNNISRVPIDAYGGGGSGSGSSGGMVQVRTDVTDVTAGDGSSGSGSESDGRNQEEVAPSGATMRRKTCRLCATCKRGFRRGSSGSYDCLKCPPKESGITTFLLVLGSIGLGLAMVALVLNTMSDAGNDLASDALQKIFVNYLQAAALALAFPLQWPPAVKNILVIQGAISTVGEFFVNPDCQLRTLTAAELFYSKSMAYAIIPFILLVTSATFWFLVGKWQKQPWYAPRGINRVSRRDPNTTYPSDRFILSVVILLYLVYPTLCKQTFRLFNCLEIHGHWYLSQDLEVECYHGTHLTMILLVGIPQILAYVIGLPLMAFVIMYRKHTIRNSHHVKYRYGILYSGFRKNMLYWECVVALRKVSISAVTVLVSEFGVGMQIHLALLVLMVSLTIHLAARPFMPQWRMLEHYEAASLIVCWLTMWSGIVFHADEKGNQQSSKVTIETTSIFIVVINSFFFLLMVLSIVYQRVVEKPNLKIWCQKTCVCGSLLKFMQRCVPLVDKKPLVVAGVRKLGSRKQSRRQQTQQILDHDMPIVQSRRKISARFWRDSALRNETFGIDGTLGGDSNPLYVAKKVDDNDGISGEATL